jgi:hypothetical protein
MCPNVCPPCLRSKQRGRWPFAAAKGRMGVAQTMAPHPERPPSVTAAPRHLPRKGGRQSVKPAKVQRDAPWYKSFRHIRNGKGRLMSRPFHVLTLAGQLSRMGFKRDECERELQKIIGTDRLCRNDAEFCLKGMRCTFAQE